MPWKYKSRIIKQGKSWQDDYGIQHPSTWMRWSDEAKISKGLVWEEPPLPFDGRFYFGRDLDGNLIERDLADLKATETRKVKEMARGLLNETDWYITREVEEGTNCPTNIKNYRRAVRIKSDEIERLIDICVIMDEFKALFDTTIELDNGDFVSPINNWPRLEDF